MFRFVFLSFLAVLTACKSPAPTDVQQVVTQVAPAPPPVPVAASVVPDLPKAPAVASPGVLPPGHPPLQGQLPAGHPPVAAQGVAPGALPEGHPPIGAEGPVAVGEFPPLDKPLAEVRRDKTMLAGQTLTLRGRVVKVNLGILDRNWVHLRDSTTEKAVVVTTTATVRRGDLVTARGKLAIDRDVGAGYVYDVLLEDATVAVEVAAAP